jgi:quercetin dioxygenase-like cupin family protein
MPGGSTNEREKPAVKFGGRELQRGASSIPGRVIVQAADRIAAGEESGWHTHPGEEVGYVLTGAVHLWIQGRPTLLLQAGEFFLIPEKIPHNALAVGHISLRMLSTFIVDAGEPLSTVIKSSSNGLTMRPEEE